MGSVLRDFRKLLLASVILFSLVDCLPVKFLPYFFKLEK